MRRSIERRLEILETTSSHAEPLGSYIALDEAGNLHVGSFVKWVCDYCSSVVGGS
jgi:hypothetical protein